MAKAGIELDKNLPFSTLRDQEISRSVSRCERSAQPEGVSPVGTIRFRNHRLQVLPHVCGGAGKGSLRNHFHRPALKRIRFCQRRDAFVQGGQHSSPSEGKSEQVRIGHLLMSEQL